MKKICFIQYAIVSIAASLLLMPICAQSDVVPYTVKPVHGEYQDWSILGVSYRQDKKNLRAILGNSTAITAARHQKTKPWPDGVILAKVVWKESSHPHWPTAIVPGVFEEAVAMVKDSKKYVSSGGWGFAYWQDKKLQMFEEAKSKECFACHSPMKNNDYVYTFSALQ